MRTIIDLTALQVRALKRIADREGISRAEAVRRAIDLAYPAEDARLTASAARQRAFGLWRERKIDALSYVNALRDTWGS